MVSFKLLTPALALASGALGASCGNGKTMTITNVAQASAIAGCRTYSGSISIATSAAGDIALNGVSEITGDLSAKNVKGMTTLSADSLTTIGGTFELNHLSGIQGLTFSMLQKVKTIYWNGLGLGLLSLDFASGITQVSNLTILDTQLQSLEGIDLSETDFFKLSSNTQLSNFTMGLSKVTSSLIIGGAANGLKVDLSSLKQAGDIQLGAISSVDFTKLEKTTSGALSVEGTFLKELELPALTQAAGISISENNVLKSVSFPKLVNDTQGMSIQKNDKLEGTISFPQMMYVGGACYFIGAFGGILLPKIHTVVGSLIIKSTKNIENNVCSKYNKLDGTVVRGKVQCSGQAPKKTGGGGGHNGGGNGGSGGNGGGNGGSGGGSGGAAANIGAPITAAMTTFGALALAFALFM